MVWPFQTGNDFGVIFCGAWRAIAAIVMPAPFSLLFPFQSLKDPSGGGRPIGEWIPLPLCP